MHSLYYYNSTIPFWSINTFQHHHPHSCLPFLSRTSSIHSSTRLHCLIYCFSLHDSLSPCLLTYLSQLNCQTEQPYAASTSQPFRTFFFVASQTHLRKDTDTQTISLGSSSAAARLHNILQIRYESSASFD